MSNYAIPQLRSILTESYNDEEPGFLCFDYFRVVYRQFTNGWTYGQIPRLQTAATIFGVVEVIIRIRYEYPH